MEKRKRKNSCSDDEDPAAVIESQGRKNRNYHSFTNLVIFYQIYPKFYKQYFSYDGYQQFALEILKCKTIVKSSGLIKVKNLNYCTWDVKVGRS